MYLHIGGEYQIDIRYITGIFDVDGITRNNSQISIDFLAKLEEKNILLVVSDDIPRSLILSVERAYLSPISAATLKQRLKDGLKTYY